MTIPLESRRSIVWSITLSHLVFQHSGLNTDLAVMVLTLLKVLAFQRGCQAADLESQTSVFGYRVPAYIMLPFPFCELIELVIYNLIINVIFQK